MFSVPAQPCVGLNLYGDEGQVFDGQEHVCLNWGSEVTPFPTVSRFSRFLIAVLPTRLCWKAPNKVNISLQETLRPIIESFKVLESRGAVGLRAKLIACKLDWKFLVQSLHLSPQPSKDAVCRKCGATKSLLAPYTDMSSHAVWRTTPPVQPVHLLDPMIGHLHSWPIIGLDVMHIFHLGVGRDLAASVLVLLVPSRHYSGRKAPLPCAQLPCALLARVQLPCALLLCHGFLKTMCAAVLGQAEDRMFAASEDIKAWAKANLENKSFPRGWKITKSRLSFKKQICSFDRESVAH